MQVRSLVVIVWGGCRECRKGYRNEIGNQKVRGRPVSEGDFFGVVGRGIRKGQSDSMFTWVDREGGEARKVHFCLSLNVK